MDFPFEVKEPQLAADSALGSKVLIVDDEDVVRDLLLMVLSRESHVNAVGLADPYDAVARLREERFDVLITDKNLAGMGGLQLIAEARRLQPTLESIMITGYPTAESIISAFAAGAS